MQCPSHLILVHPRDFGFNAQTAASNSFQHNTGTSDTTLAAEAEFKATLQTLTENNVLFTVHDSPTGVHVPDAVFPNNWFAVMPDGTLLVFPMLAPNRRHEINGDLLQSLENNFSITRRIDLSQKAGENIFLEGTGSIVFDHDAYIAYACESPRTDLKLFNELCSKIGYAPVSFLALDLKGQPVYHTNVVMSIGKAVAVICTEMIADALERAMLLNVLAQTGKKIIDITYDQANHFCANILQVTDAGKNPLWLMSQTAYDNYTPAQLAMLSASGRIVSIAIPTIETIGGGSLRCMLAGIHAPAK